MKTGFTLVEVLLSFVIFVSGLVLVVTGFSRHLAALTLLQNSIVADRLAEKQLIHEISRRELGLQIPDDSSEEGYAFQMFLDPVHMEQEPLKDLIVEKAMVDVSWSYRNKPRSIQMTTGFSRKEDAGKEGE